MRVRRATIAIVLGLTATAAADPKPTPVDIKPLRDGAIVLQDVKGGTYVVTTGAEARAFYGTGTTLYEQVPVGRSRNGDAWTFSAWAPRLPNIQSGAIDRLEDGTFRRTCSGTSFEVMALTQITGDRAAQILAKDTFLTTATIRRPHLLARDDSGTYYYVDRLANLYGGKGYRVFVGKKGAMVQIPLEEVASDSAGSVFATKRGDLRLAGTNGESDAGTMPAITWIKGEKHVSLVALDTDANSRLIYRELGIYGFIGSLCEDL